MKGTILVVAARDSDHERHRETIAAAVAAVAGEGPREGAAQVVELLLGLDAWGWPKAKPRIAQVIDLAGWRPSREVEAEDV